jgi:hypothetical protein
VTGTAKSPRCPGRARHWRIALGTVGTRTPVCVFCGSPNPKPLSKEEWARLIGYAQAGGRPGRLVEAAISTRLAEARPS